MRRYEYVAALRVNSFRARRVVPVARSGGLEADDAVKAFSDVVTMLAEEYGDGGIVAASIAISPVREKRPAGGSDATRGQAEATA